MASRSAAVLALPAGVARAESPAKVNAKARRSLDGVRLFLSKPVRRLPVTFSCNFFRVPQRICKKKNAAVVECHMNTDNQSRVQSKALAAGLLLLRIGAGIPLLFVHGWQKLADAGGFVFAIPFAVLIVTGPGQFSFDELIQRAPAFSYLHLVSR
jgi:hypothetical protein